MTIGTGGRVAGELARQQLDSPPLRWTVMLCGLAQVAGIALFFANMWPRIRPVGSQQREARGEKF